MLLAQTVADLSSLKAADPSAATALVNTHKTIGPTRTHISANPASQTEEEANRAATLKALYDLRTKLSQQDNTALIKARERINNLAAKRMNNNW